MGKMEALLASNLFDDFEARYDLIQQWLHIILSEQYG